MMDRRNSLNLLHPYLLHVVHTSHYHSPETFLLGRVLLNIAYVVW